MKNVIKFVLLVIVLVISVSIVMVDVIVEGVCFIGDIEFVGFCKVVVKDDVCLFCLVVVCNVGLIGFS